MGDDTMTIIDAAPQRGARWPRRAGVGMASCKGCGKATNSRTGYCQSNLECIRFDTAIRRGRVPGERKNCSGCGRPIMSTNRTGYCSMNPECQRIQWREISDAYIKEHPDSALWNHAKIRARKRMIPFTITREDIRDVWTDTCPILGMPLRSVYSGPLSPNSRSIDCIEPRRGYVPGNIQMISHMANRMKSNATPEELLMFADWIYATFGKDR